MNDPQMQIIEKLSFKQQFELIKIIHETQDQDIKRYAKILLETNHGSIIPKEWLIK